MGKGIRSVKNNSLTQSFAYPMLLIFSLSFSTLKRIHRAEMPLSGASDFIYQAEVELAPLRLWGCVLHQKQHSLLSSLNSAPVSRRAR